MTKEKEICPKCKKNDLELPLALNAVSRDDNETYICSECGQVGEFAEMGF